LEHYPGACTPRNDRDLINFFISRSAYISNSSLRGAAKGGHRGLIDFFIRKGAGDWNSAMNCVTENGHKDLVNLFIQKGANDWRGGLESAKNINEKR